MNIQISYLERIGPNSPLELYLCTTPTLKNWDVEDKKIKILGVHKYCGFGQAITSSYVNRPAKNCTPQEFIMFDPKQCPIQKIPEHKKYLEEKIMMFKKTIITMENRLRGIEEEESEEEDDENHDDDDDQEEDDQSEDRDEGDQEECGKTVKAGVDKKKLKKNEKPPAKKKDKSTRAAGKINFEDIEKAGTQKRTSPRVIAGNKCLDKTEFPGSKMTKSAVAFMENIEKAATQKEQVQGLCRQ
ncbi:hypothetical protein LIER_31526 [Lithospermum erythrorhizon]|uniref:Uncharacterized protein n=1 Tax=Lithospermum erythrorhizon TaxID=34254 RepID=A0AAV3RT47_LITER